MSQHDFFTARVDLTSNYTNKFLSLVDDTHLHRGVPSTVCGVCNTLAAAAACEVSAGARAVRPSRSSRRKTPNAASSATARQDPCAPRDSTSTTTVAIDEIASTQEWMQRLRRDGDAIARYLIDNKCDISKFTIQDMLGIMRRLNIVRVDRQELFDLLAHIKGSLSSTSAAVRTTHPLVMIHSRANPRIGEQLRELERVYAPARYQTLVATTRFQSANFTDMSSSQDLLFKYRDGDSTCYVHPIMVALFGVKLPAIEQAFVYGDSYSLLRQLYEFRKVKPDNYMLLVNRLTEESPILIAGINDAISAEIQRASIHSMIRKLILNIRLGIFYCEDCEAVDPLLMKIIHTGSTQMMPDEEQLLASILSIVSVRPALVSVAKSSAMACPSSSISLRSVPYVVVNPSLIISTVDNPISINSNSVHSLTFDGATGKVLFAPPNLSYQGHFGVGGVDTLPILQGGGVSMLGRMTSPIIVNGTLMYYVDRRQQRNVIGGECLTGFRSIIHDVPMDVAGEISINGISYRLKSAVCYKISDQVGGGCDITDSFLRGYYTILFTEMGPWMYDPLSVFSKPAREARLMRALKNYYRQENPDADESMFFDWVKQESTQPIYIAKQQQLMNHRATFEDDLISMDEAMAMVSRYCCVLVYSQDYDPYISTKSIADIFC